MFAKPIVADFFLEKDPIFARLNLDDEEYALYHQIYQHLHIKASKPDLVIYLQTPIDALVARVEERNVSYEQDIPREYLERLANAYSEFFHNYDASPILIVNNEKLNILKNANCFGVQLHCWINVRNEAVVNFIYKYATSCFLQLQQRITVILLFTLRRL